MEFKKFECYIKSRIHCIEGELKNMNKAKDKMNLDAFAMLGQFMNNHAVRYAKGEMGAEEKKDIEENYGRNCLSSALNSAVDYNSPSRSPVFELPYTVTDIVHNGAMVSLDSKPIRLTTKDASYLSHSLINYISYALDLLCSKEESNFNIFGTRFLKYDFTNMPREEVLDIVEVDNLINFVAECFSEFSSSASFDFKVKMELFLYKVKECRDYGYAKLSAITGLSRGNIQTILNIYWDRGLYMLPQNRQPEGVSMGTAYEMGDLYCEPYAILRHIIETSPVIDGNCNPLHDGYGLMYSADGNEAMGQLYDMTNDCYSIPEIENTLKSTSDNRPFVNNLLNGIRQEPFRSVFADCMQKMKVEDIVYYKTAEEAWNIGQNSDDKYTSQSNGKRILSAENIHRRRHPKSVGEMFLNMHNWDMTTEMEKNIGVAVKRLFGNERLCKTLKKNLGLADGAFKSPSAFIDAYDEVANKHRGILLNSNEYRSCGEMLDAMEEIAAGWI